MSESTYSVFEQAASSKEFLNLDSPEVESVSTLESIELPPIQTPLIISKKPFHQETEMSEVKRLSVLEEKKDAMFTPTSYKQETEFPKP
jgi:hypothetical protein